MKILFVDDDNISQEMMSLMLSQRGYKVVTASNGLEAVEAVNKDSFDLILMDIQMPVMDGIEACKLIRNRSDSKRNIPIVALTASEMVASVRECIDAGMNDFVSKPFSVQQLFHIIQSLLDDGTIPSVQDGDTTETDDTRELPVLNTQIALMNCGNDVVQYQRLLREFMSTLPEKVDKVHVSFSNGTRDYAMRLLHNLKGVSATLGAMKMSYAAGQLERSCDSDDLEVIDSDFQYLNSTVEEFFTQVDVLLNKQESLDQNISLSKGE